MSLVGASKQHFDFVKTTIRNSPWISIAVLMHILLFAVLSVWYLASGKVKEESINVPVTMAARVPTATEEIEKPPEIIDRNSVPVLPDQEEGPVNPDPNYVPDAAPGKAGEITDETDPTKEAGIFNPDPEALSNLPSGATGGTPIGVGSVGHKGTATSAFSSRRAGGGGKGGGGLGQGGKGGRGGGTQAAVMSALLWLKNHQSPDGNWDCDAFSDRCKKNKCSGAGQAPHDAGVTGLALLCFLGANETTQEGSCKETVKNGLKYLISIQQPDGCFGERASQHFMYDHACAALAMAEAYGMTQTKAFKEPAQKGVNFIMQSQNPYSAWRYASPPDGSNDTSVTGWMVMVIKSARLAGLTVDEASLTNAMQWINEMTDPGTGRTGYTDVGGLPSRLTELMTQFPAERSESMTAVGVLVRVFAGHTAEEDPLILKGADLMALKPPKWDTATGDIDFYYWYYATLAMFQVGGPRFDKWNEALKTAVVDHQRVNPDEDEYGSWDPVDPWSIAGGRVYSTAVNCLSMEVYYRYPRVFGATHKPAAGGDKKPVAPAGGK